MGYGANVEAVKAGNATAYAVGEYSAVVSDLCGVKGLVGAGLEGGVRLAIRNADEVPEPNFVDLGLDGLEGSLDAPRVLAAERGLLPSGVGGTGRAYNKATGQGLYVLRDELGNVRYVGRGDAPVSSPFNLCH
ncbi:MAG: hypothetical protein AAGB16_02910 [Pseudomonadota bacterium]